MFNTAVLSPTDLYEAQGSKRVSFVANRTRQTNAYSTSFKQWRGRLGMIVMDNVSRIKLVIPNWYTNSSGEQGTGGALLVRAAIEKLDGTIVQVTFSNAAEGSVASLTELESDWVNISLKKGEKIYYRYWHSMAAGGMLYCGGTNMPFANYDDGDYHQYHATAVTDNTMGGAYDPTGLSSDANGGFSTPPLCVLGETRRPTIGIVGDSRAEGINDKTGGWRKARGQIERSIAPIYACANFSQGGETGGGFTGSQGARRRYYLTKYASSLICEYGINDMNATWTVTQTTLTNLWTGLKTAAAANDNAEMKLFACTLTPYVTGSASTAGSSSGTTASLTIPTADAAKVTVGEKVRVSGAAPSGYNGIVTLTGVNTGTGVIQYTLPSGGSGLANLTTQANVYDMYGKFQVTAGSPASRTSVNEWIRKVPSQLNGFFEISDILTTYRNSGLWDPAKVYDGNDIWDGLHETSKMLQIIEQSNVFKPEMFMREAA